MPKPNLVVVKWGDAWVKAGAHKVKRLKVAPYTTYTVGFLVKEGEEGVWLSAEYWPDEPGNASYPTFIPRGMIYSIRSIRASFLDDETRP